MLINFLFQKYESVNYVPSILLNIRDSYSLLSFIIAASYCKILYRLTMLLKYNQKLTRLHVT